MVQESAEISPKMPESTLEYQASQVAYPCPPKSNTPRQPEDVLISALENCKAAKRLREKLDKIVGGSYLFDLCSDLESANEKTPPDYPLMLETIHKIIRAWTAGAQILEKWPPLIQERIDSQYPELYKAIVKLPIDDFNRLYTSMKRVEALQIQQEPCQRESSSTHQIGTSYGVVSTAPGCRPSESELLRKVDEIRAMPYSSPPPYSVGKNSEVADSALNLNAHVKPNRSYWRRILNHSPGIRENAK